MLPRINDLLGKTKAEIFKKYKTKAQLTDWSILNGAEAYYEDNRCYGKFFLEETKENKVFCINHFGIAVIENMNSTNIGIRIVIPYSAIKDLRLLTLNEDISPSGIKEIEYGLYPENLENPVVANKLRKLYLKNQLPTTGESFTGGSALDFKKQDVLEFEDKKYVLVQDEDNTSALSQKYVPTVNHSYFLRIKPIKWLVDEEKDIAITKNIIAAGVDKKNLKSFIKNLLREMLQGTNYRKKEKNIVRKRTQ